VDFVLSKEGQKLAVETASYMPIRRDVTPPEGYPRLSETKFLQGDPKLLSQVREEDKRKFAQLFGLPQ